MTGRSGAMGSGLSRPAAIGVVAAALGFTAVMAIRNGPHPMRPRIRRWYKQLDKPGYTPPDPVFGGAWGIVESGLAVGGYRLLRMPPGQPRNLATGLWLVNFAMIGGWTELFSRQKQLGPSAAASGAMIVGGIGYVAAAARADRTSELAGVPYVLWLGFATLLAERI